MDLGWLAGLAPTVARALGGPVAGMAVEAIGAALGIEQPTRQSIDEMLAGGQLSGAQVAALKQAELALQQRLRELDIDLEQVHAQDRDSARRMQAETGSWAPPVLAFVITTGFFGLMIGMGLGWLGGLDGATGQLLMGGLGTAWAQVVSYYYGSSSGSARKDNLLAQAPPIAAGGGR